MRSIPDTESKVRALLDMALSVLPHEIGCDDFSEFLAAYADHIVNGSEVPEPLKLVAEHAERCSSCLEELNYLLAALKSAENPG